MTACVYNAINLANGREVAIKSFKRSVYFAQDNGNGKVLRHLSRFPLWKSLRSWLKLSIKIFVNFFPFFKQKTQLTLYWSFILFLSMDIFRNAGFRTSSKPRLLWLTFFKELPTFMPKESCTEIWNLKILWSKGMKLNLDELFQSLLT